MRRRATREEDAPGAASVASRARAACCHSRGVRQPCLVGPAAEPRERRRRTRTPGGRPGGARKPPGSRESHFLPSGWEGGCRKEYACDQESIIEISPNKLRPTCHCEECNDEAIQLDRHGALRAPRDDINCNLIGELSIIPTFHVLAYQQPPPCPR